MIRRLKIKLILISMSAFLLLLSAILAGINILNYTSVIKEVDEILLLLSDNQGSFPEIGQVSPPPVEPAPIAARDEKAASPSEDLPTLSPELPYETRYFSVLLDKNGTVLTANVRHIISVDASSAATYAAKAMQMEKDTAFLGRFRYLRAIETDGIRITFLDCGQRLDSFYNFMIISIMIAAVAFVVVTLLLYFLAERILRPVAESYEKQKRFVTDAGHEIKTPLTIINANADLLELEIGENESLSEIQQQTRRLARLTNDLVLLARMEESQPGGAMIDIPLSELVRETAEEFRASAESAQRTFLCEIQPMRTIRGNSRAIQHLVSILMDNAVKYTPDGGEIRLSLTEHGNGALLTVSNTTKQRITEEQLSHVFDRFYRVDESRNSATGGHGIGLSIAQSIVLSHGGRIVASAKRPFTFSISVLLPNRPQRAANARRRNAL